MSGIWLASYVLLWILVAVQALVVVALMRQVGTLLLRVGTSTAFDLGTGPAAGEDAPWLPSEAFDTNGGTGGRATLLVFLSTGCGICDVIAPGMNAIMSAYADSARVFGVAREKQDVVESWAQTKRVRVPMLTEAAAFDAYAVSGTPYAYVIDAKGVVQAGGGVNTTDQLETLLRQCISAPTRSSEGRELEILGANRKGGEKR